MKRALWERKRADAEEQGITLPKPEDLSDDYSYGEEGDEMDEIGEADANFKASLLPSIDDPKLW